MFLICFFRALQQIYNNQNSITNMKRLNYLFLFLAAIFLNGCSETGEETITYKINEPVFMSMDLFRKPVRVSPEPREIKKQGKIAFYQGFMYISEPEKGIHIIDNSNPKKPLVVGFIELIGNVDMAIKDDILYADSYIDMVWFDISNPANPKFLGRKENVFPESLPMTDNNYIYDYEQAYNRSKGIVVGWVVRERTEKYTYNRGSSGWWGGGFAKYDSAGPTSNLASGGGVGQTGSMSRFAIYKDCLYTVMNNVLGIFNIESKEPRQMGENFYVGWNVETIFSYKHYMYMGTPTGMLIYSVADPLKPKKLASVQHVYGCDPVVVEDDIAYVTIHAGNLCGQNANQLLIYNVENPETQKPKHIVTYEMTQPKGLGIDKGTLFICDEGLKVFNAADPMTIMAPENRLAHYKGMDGYDLIPFENVLMMIASDGIYQYDYSDLKNIKPLSKLTIGK